MKQIESYHAPKYESEMYSLVEDGIYRVESGGEVLYVTSLSFVQEPELEEGGSAAEISQYPLEDILDNIGPTAEVVKVIRPIYNFKAGEEG